ncbi:DNA/RNA nuclease SfsA [candidate division KSB3 bacterium]|uniref:DNA/RNA nuclease SfsA n=1 Tax=candidate division KSB3 bacterium TaxID=2044937 RepID=A0A2G6E6K5_9BACT|nr:MAG: DNA/RNA nuclease SfsA [candidate division KSB3 bacterium]PIE29937.1 MAG: DNA/RNA nuclease SfsA [candidate division KSB3 bacterium]
MEQLKLYDAVEESCFLERLNRFVMRLRNAEGQEFQAHIPNPGRMEEFCFKNQPFYVTAAQNGKYPYKVIATRYQGSYVFLDTIKVNRVFEELLRRNQIPCFQNVKDIRREVRVADSKFDFSFKQAGRPIITEIKSCTLCHNGLAMFPDAPTLRGQRHMTSLERIAEKGDVAAHLVYLVLHAAARRFIPNVHTDFDYGKIFLNAQHVRSHAFRLEFSGPATAEPGSLQEIPIDFSALETHCRDKGSYLLLLENPKALTIKVGRLGVRHFESGWYVYVGSAMNGLNSRLRRHQRKRKTLHWHIDYIASTAMKITKIFPIRKAEKLESWLAGRLAEICDASVPQFGASDLPEDSHLFYFRETPMKNRCFVDIIFDSRVL